MALLAMALAVYGSLVPLEYRALQWNEAVRQFLAIPYLTIDIDHRADWVANILLFVPISFLLVAAVNQDRRVGLLTICWPAVTVIACAGLSLSLEFAQLWFPPRTVSRNDILAESLGGVIGACLWIVSGKKLTSWIRRFTSTRDRAVRCYWLLQAYTLGLAAYAVLPLDLVIHRSEVLDKAQDGRLTWLPWSDVSLEPASLFRLLGNAAMFVPPGMLVAAPSSDFSRPMRPLAQSLGLGVLLVMLLEFAQLPVYSRFFSTTDMLSGMVGVVIGTFLVRNWSTLRALKLHSLRARHYLWAAAGYSLLVLAISCVPFEFVANAGERASRLSSIWVVPFSRLYRGSEFNALTVILQKGLIFAPLGILLGLALSTLRLRRPPSWVARIFFGILAAAVAMSVELAQVFVSSRYPDITDVLIGTAAAVLGMYLTNRLATHRL